MSETVTETTLTKTLADISQMESDPTKQAALFARRIRYATTFCNKNNNRNQPPHEVSPRPV
jgi:hypothetical protein